MILYLLFYKKKNWDRLNFKYSNLPIFKLRRLTSHFELSGKDYLSQRNLRKILGKTTLSLEFFIMNKME